MSKKEFGGWREKQIERNFSAMYEKRKGKYICTSVFFFFLIKDEIYQDEEKIITKS